MGSEKSPLSREAPRPMYLICFFAYDLLIFCKANRNSFERLTSLLENLDHNTRFVLIKTKIRSTSEKGVKNKKSYKI